MTFVKFHTNLDDYRSFHFPDLEIIPRIGEAVSVCDGFIYYFRGKNLPSRLEVVDVTYRENDVLVELWYRATDYKMIQLNKS